MKFKCAMVLAIVAGSAFAERIQMPSGCTTPDGMAIDPKGRLVIAAANVSDRSKPGAVFRMDAPDKAPVKWFEVPPHPESGYAQPMGIAFGPDGELYLCDCQEPGKGRLLRFEFAADDSVAKCETVADGLANANGVKYYKGRLYLSQAKVPRAKRNKEGSASAIYCFSATDRNVKVTNTEADSQMVFCDSTMNPKMAVGLNGVAIDKNGYLYTGNYGDGRVWRLKIGEDGKIAEKKVFVEPSEENGIVSPDGMCVDEEGNLYIADMFGYSAQKVTPDGKVITLMKNPPDVKDGLERPSEPCFWKGCLYLSNWGGTTLFRLK